MKRVRVLLAVFLVMAMIVLDLQPLAAYAATDDPGVEITQYTITYHLDGGTNALKNPDVYTEEDTITLMDATKVGYDFVGWFWDVDKTVQVTQISGLGNVDVYAKFIPISYTATFSDNGATQSSTLTITLDDTIGTIETHNLNNNNSFNPYYWIPTRKGYVFAGWYIDTQLVSDSVKITDNLTLKARWIKCSLPENGEFIVLGETSKGIVSFDSWLYSKKTTIGWDGIEYETIGSHEGTSTMSYIYVYVSGEYKNIVYTAQYGAHSFYEKSYCDIYDVTNQKQLVGSLYNNDWNTYSGTLELDPGTLLKIGVGAWNCSKYGKIDISLGDYRRSKISPANERMVECEFDSYINAPSVSKTGYKFLGWYDAFGNQMTDTWQYTEDQTFTAKWQPQQYDIVYELNGGTNSPANPSSYTIEDSITLSNPTKPGYTFKGWYSDADFTKNVTTISKKTGNITLYAKWAVNRYNLTLDANQGTFAPEVTFISDGTEIKRCYLYEQDAITTYCPDHKDGYIFAGWYTDDAFTSLFEFNGTIKNDITLYAKWIACDSNIISIETAGTINTTIQGKTEQLYAFVPLVDGAITVTSESNNLDLYGILYDASKSILISADDISSMDLDFSYTYSVTAGQLYYLAVKGTTASTSGPAVIDIQWIGDCEITGTTYRNRQMTVLYGTNYKLPQKPIREGYVFLGWFDENGTKITDGAWEFVTDKTLTAKWETATYHNVTFKDQTGWIISSETYYLGEEILAPELPTKAPDHTYTYSVKWDNNFTGVCTGDAVYSPVFEPTYIDYTVIFVDEDGTELSSATYHWGDTVTVPAVPTKDSDNTDAYIYTFAGWDKEVVPCAGDATYTATYLRTYIEYTVIFADADGTELSRATYHYGDAPTVPATEPTRNPDPQSHYVFIGWTPSVSNVSADATYTAIYQATAHSYNATTVAATCMEPGKIIHACTSCVYSYNEILPAEGHSYSTKVTAPTCTNAGMKTIVCIRCSHSINEPISATGHSFANGSCTTCGVADLNYTPGVTRPTLTLKSPTLEFKDMITVNAFYTAENIQDVVEMGMITYSSNVSNVNIYTAEHVIPGATYVESDRRYYSSSQGIHAKYLGDTIYLAIYAKLSDGSYVYSKLAPYSAVQYATSQLQNSSDAKLKQLVVAMLNYGAEAQLYFGHNTGSLANASLTADQKGLPEAYRSDMIQSVPAASAAKQGVFVNNQGFAGRKPAISFEGAFCINYFFTPKYTPDSGITLHYWNAEDYNAASVLTAANATGSMKLVGSGIGDYRGDLTGISAKALADAVYVAAVYESGGTTWTSGVLGYSIGAYCSNQASVGGTISGLAKTTAIYGYHAKAYFG